MTGPVISRGEIALAVGRRLLGVTNATGYFGQIGALYGLPDAPASPPEHPPTKGGGDQRVKPYFIVEPGAGQPGDEVDLADTTVDLDVPYVIRAVAGDTEDLLALVDRIDALIYRWAPPLPDGVRSGPFRYPPGTVAPLLTDDSVKPPRQYVPLQYQLTAHT